MRALKLLLPLALAGAIFYGSLPGAAGASAPSSATAGARSPSGSSAPSGPSAPSSSSAHTPSLYSSHELWATVDVCNAADQPHTIGLRGSMPADGHPHDSMFMRFRVQYANPTTKAWTYLSKDGDSGYLPVGTAATTRQSGRSFQLVPVAGQPTFKLRGVISFQWRRGTKVLYSTSLNTTAGHRSLAGSDPRGFSAATCALT